MDPVDAWFVAGDAWILGLAGDAWLPVASRRRIPPSRSGRGVDCLTASSGSHVDSGLSELGTTIQLGAWGQTRCRSYGGEVKQSEDNKTKRKRTSNY